jgi:hypothetical protein
MSAGSRTHNHPCGLPALRYGNAVVGLSVECGGHGGVVACAELVRVSFPAPTVVRIWMATQSASGAQVCLQTKQNGPGLIDCRPGYDVLAPTLTAAPLGFGRTTSPTPLRPLPRVARRAK